MTWSYSPCAAARGRNREVGRNLVGQVAAITQAGERIGLAGFFQPCIGGMQFSRPCLHLVLQRHALARMPLQLEAISRIQQHREQQAQQQAKQPRLVEQRLDAEVEQCRSRTPDTGVVRTDHLEGVLPRRQVGVIRAAPARIVQAMPITVVSEQPIAQLDACGSWKLSAVNSKLRSRADAGSTMRAPGVVGTDCQPSGVRTRSITSAGGIRFLTISCVSSATTPSSAGSSAHR